MKLLARALGNWLPATVLTVAGVAKLLNPGPFVQTLHWFGLSDTPAIIGGYAIPSVELGMAAALMVLGSRRWAICGAIGMFLTFSLALVYMLSSNDPPACNCLGALRLFSDARRELLFGLARNLLVLGAMVWALAEWCPAERRIAPVV